MLQGDLFGAIVRGSQIDDLYPSGVCSGSPQTGEQLPPPLRSRAAADDDTLRLDGRKCIDQGLRRFTDLRKQERGRTRQLAAQLGRELPDSERHRSGTEVTADYDDKCLG
ncbi:MAG: hypothetical protein ACLQHS_13895 [Candidatus Limnocylindrales bacterium]